MPNPQWTNALLARLAPARLALMRLMIPSIAKRCDR